LGDRIETEAIKRALGRHAFTIPVTALKSVTGHMLAASGALEAAIALMCLREGLIVPTAHLKEGDPACDLDYVTSCRHTDAVYTLSQSFGFGGLNAVIVFKKADV
jgi:3-oxoacyl-[acyl-carrier-protein] synthase II